MRSLLCVLAVLLLAGCATPPVVDRAECAARGGTVRSVGMFATPACVIPYPDAGKACSDASECQGVCMAEAGAVVGDFAIGTCQRDNRDVFGCYHEIEKGVVVGGMCVD
ncbi:MAG: hypothetical protein J7507_09710 [Pseudoxanthomonas sp.]|nr:hypothetical protein [Pseudoxanthomonas sp.]